jgi:hypothetical protein
VAESEQRWRDLNIPCDHLPSRCATGDGLC